MKITTTTALETLQLGSKIGEWCRPGDLILLCGELGTGKTLFTKGIAAALGIPPQRVVSPSFTIIFEYHQGRLPLYHMDLYRLNHPQELEDLGMERYFHNDGLVVIEWANRMPDALPNPSLVLSFQWEGEHGRTIEIEARNQRWKEILEQQFKGKFMNLDVRLQNVSVVGAAGKMGRGISLLLAQEMAFLKLQNPTLPIALHLIDVYEPGLEGLWNYIRTQAASTAERQMIKLREFYKNRADLVENEEIVREFVFTTLSLLRPATEMEVARKSSLVFEAALEDESAKLAIFQKLKAICTPDTYFLTNTSSIPIQILDTKAGLDGRLIGFHFYNPPAVQKLVEVIVAAKTRPELADLAQSLIKRLGKTPVPACDVAGFIGNGHFIREGNFAMDRARKLGSDYPLPQAIYLINKVSQDLLLRPMGIFQLIDYVGIDVFYCIQKAMTGYLGQNLMDKLIDEMLSQKILGGQFSDGSQKDGFFKYDKSRLTGVYDLASRKYLLFAEENWAKKLDDKLGTLPANWPSWKGLSGDAQKEAKLQAAFLQLQKVATLGSSLAKEYAQKSREIAQKLVQDGVAKADADVNNVLVTGFYHLYGPIHNYL